MDEAGNSSEFGMCFFVPNYKTTSIRAVYITDVLIVLFSVMFFVAAVSENVLVIHVITRNRHLRSCPSHLLLCSLAISDLVIGTLVQTSWILSKIGELRELQLLHCVARLVAVCCGWICACVSFLTISAIIIDRYLALRLHMRYNAVITTDRVLRLVVMFWLFCIALVLLRFIPLVEKSWILIPLALLLVSIVPTVVAYLRMFRVIRQIHAIDSHQSSSGHSAMTPQRALSIARYKRTAATMFYVLLLFIACYLPFIATMCAEASLGYTLTVRIVYDYSATIVLISAAINPIVYCFRIREIRLAVITTLERKFGKLAKADNLKNLRGTATNHATVSQNVLSPVSS